MYFFSMETSTPPTPQDPTGEELLALIANSPRMPLRDDDAARLAVMEPLTFGGAEVRQAWSIGAGPLVVLVHGWGGNGAQLAPLATALSAAGFRCVLFDALGHGQSAGGRIGFDAFGYDTAALCSHLGETLHAVIGHSAGALGMMAARYRHGLSASHYVCLAMPRYPYVPLETLKGKFGFTDRQLLALKPLLAEQFDRSWSDLEAGCVFSGDPAGQLTLIYDLADPRVRHQDADAIAAVWPGAEVIKTDNLGHNRILRSPDVIAAIERVLRDNRNVEGSGRTPTRTNCAHA
jgi:pimeloyl-ACP methyl ester carboxylesterase